VSVTVSRPESSAQPGALPRLAVLFEATSVQVFHLVEAARDTWETVWLIDRDIEGLDNLPRLLARFGDVVDITGLGPAQVKSALRARPIDGIIAFDDSLLVRAALIADELGLPFYSPATAERLTDKIAQREAFRAAGLPTPRSTLVPAGAGADRYRAVAEEVTFPVVVKPVSGSGSRDVFAVDDMDSLVALFGESTPHLSRQDMVVEERIPDGWPADEHPYGDFVTVETFMSHGRASHFGVTGCMAQAEGFRLTGNFQPSNISTDDWSSATHAAEQALAALGADIGVFHTEVKFAASGRRVVEVNGRVGGGGVTRIATLATGRDLLNAAGRIALGEDVDMSGAEFSCVAFFHRYQPPLGARTLLRIDGLDAVRQFPGIHEVHLNRRPGDSLGASGQGTRGFIYSVHGQVDTHDDLWAMIERVRDTVQVSYGT